MNPTAVIARRSVALVEAKATAECLDGPRHGEGSGLVDPAGVALLAVRCVLGLLLRVDAPGLRNSEPHDVGASRGSTVGEGPTSSAPSLVGTNRGEHAHSLTGVYQHITKNRGAQCPRLRDEETNTALTLDESAASEPVGAAQTAARMIGRSEARRSPSGRSARRTAPSSAPAGNPSPCSVEDGRACLASQISPRPLEKTRQRPLRWLVKREQIISEREGYRRLDSPEVSSTRGRVVWSGEGGQVLSVTRPDSRGRGRGDRKAITRKSQRALTRLARRLREVDSRAAAWFVTLTYPGLWEWDRQPGDKRHPTKVHLDRFGKRLRRAMPSCSFVWVVDQKYRRRGESKGQLVPHVHLMMWGCPLRKREMRRLVREAWFQAVHGQGAGPEEDPDHWAAGTQADPSYSRDGLKGYLRSYCSKPKDDGFLEAFGGTWGIVGRADLPLADLNEVEATERGAVRMIRSIRKYVQAEARSRGAAPRPRRYSIGVSVGARDPSRWVTGWTRLGWLVNPGAPVPKLPRRPLRWLAQRERETRPRPQ